MTASLSDLVVADLSGSMSGAWCARLFADFGADVVVVEPPSGSPLRELEPKDPAGNSIPAAYVLANKRSILIDPEAEGARARFTQLLRCCDVVIEGRAEGSLQWFGIDREQLLAEAPAAVVVSLTPHGLSGGRADMPGNDLTAWAISGWASINGFASRPPLKGSGFVASYIAGVAAYGAAMSAIVSRDRGGPGQHVDVAESEALLEIFGPNLLSSAYGSGRSRRARADISGTFPAPVRDGHLALRFAGNERYRDTLIALGLNEAADDPRWSPVASRESEEFKQMVQERMIEWDRMPLFEALATLRVTAGPVLRVDELRENEHLRDRGFWVHPEDSLSGPEYVGAPFVMSKTPGTISRRAPRPGEHTDAVRLDLSRRQSDKGAPHE